jgi:hypothetical protein
MVCSFAPRYLFELSRFSVVCSIHIHAQLVNFTCQFFHVMTILSVVMSAQVRRCRAGKYFLCYEPCERRQQPLINARKVIPILLTVSNYYKLVLVTCPTTELRGPPSCAPHQNAPSASYLIHYNSTLAFCTALN